MKKKLGLIINPVAGLGGAVGLKGSDDPTIQKLAIERGAVRKSGAKTRTTLEAVLTLKDGVVVYAGPGEMGAGLARQMGFDTIPIGTVYDETTGEDTENITKQLASIPVDILLFAGGDGTARNVCAAMHGDIPVIGVPAGVKIHSAVYATSPAAAGKALRACLTSSVGTRQAEVMDIDEEMYREGRLQARLYGYLPAPVIRNVMQNPKAASHIGDNDVGGIVEEIRDRVRDSDKDICYIFGAGSTVAAIEEALGVDGTLLGVDVWQNGKCIGRDVAEKELLQVTERNNSRLIITAIGGQGHIFGRGNQQLSPAVIRNIGLGHIWVVATANKIYALPDQTLYVDTGEDALDKELCGYRKVIVGLQETLVCRVR